VIGQRLVRRVCDACREPYPPSERTLADLGYTPETRPRVFTRGAGCEQCVGTGYRGRTGLFEVLMMNEDLARLVVARSPEVELRARALELGALWPFLADARAKVADGTTTAEEFARQLLGISATPK
jgi:type II secretory ATPase GspE/PulE/Tfp pilus assembly ATPase PilB-like protein